MPRIALIWLRNDLRLHDHEPLAEAVREGHAPLLVYSIDPRQFARTSFGYPKTGSFRARFLLESLADLKASVAALGGRLVVLRGKPEVTIPKLAGDVRAAAVYGHAEACSEEVAVERALDSALAAVRVPFRLWWGATLHHRDDLPYDSMRELPEIFSNFRRDVERRSLVRRSVAAPKSLLPIPGIPDTRIPTLADLGLDEPAIDPRGVLAFRGGETAALERLREYLWDRDLLRVYKETRNGLVGADYSSKFSPWLALGCLSPRRIADEVARYEAERIANDSTKWLIVELLWRDFFRFSAVKYGNRIFRPGGPKGTPPRTEPSDAVMAAWQAGETGFPFVDANMRELAATGWMSNRGRQNVASFLVRDLAQPWLRGAEWLESLLIDYDPASNYGNWTYVAGVGSDPREDRYFNVVEQARRYDPHGEFIRLWCPELAHLPTSALFEPRAKALRSKRYRPANAN